MMDGADVFSSVMGTPKAKGFRRETKPVRCDVCLTGPVQRFNTTRFLRFASCSSVPLSRLRLAPWCLMPWPNGPGLFVTHQPGMVSGENQKWSDQ
jgi:hypothetical protein